MNKSLIFWDFDGVMADSSPFVFKYWQQALQAAGHTFQWEHYQATFTRKFPFDYLLENFPDCAAQIFKDYSAHEQANYPSQVKPYPEFIEHFKSLAKHHQHVVVSANLRGVIEPWLQRHQIREFFEVVEGREDPGHKDEKMRQIMAKKNISPSDCLFIGDTISDMNHAKAARVESIAVTWGVHSRQQLETVNPNHICDNMEALFHLLKGTSLRD